MTDKIPFRATVAHAYRFFFANIAGILRAIWIPLLLQLAVVLVLSRRMAMFIAAVQAKDPSAVTQFGPVLALLCIALVLFCAQFAAATEFALGRPPHGLLHVPLGRVTWKLLGGVIVAMLAIIAVFAAGLGVILVISLLLDLAIKALPNARAIAALVAALLVLALFLFSVFVATRFGFLLVPANLSESKLGVSRSWELTRGNFWRAFGVTLSVMLPIAIANYAVTFAIAGFPPSTLGMSKEAADAARMAWQATQMNALADHWYVLLPATAAIFLFQFGTLSAAQVFAWRAVTNGSAPIAGDRLPD